MFAILKNLQHHRDKIAIKKHLNNLIVYYWNNLLYCNCDVVLLHLFFKHYNIVLAILTYLPDRPATEWQEALEWMINKIKVDFIPIQLNSETKVFWRPYWLSFIFLQTTYNCFPKFRAFIQTIKPQASASDCDLTCGIHELTKKYFKFTKKKCLQRSHHRPFFRCCCYDCCKNLLIIIKRSSRDRDF